MKKINSHAASDVYVSSNLYSSSGIILVKKRMLLRQVSYRMTINLFLVLCRTYMQCGEYSAGGFYANFGGDPFTGDAPHDMFMREVLHRNGASCGTVHDRTA